MIDGHPLEYAHGQHRQDSNTSTGTANGYRPPRSSPSLSSVKRQSALAALEEETASVASLVSPASSTPSAPSTSSSHIPGDKPVISPITPRGVLSIPLHLAPSSSTPASPSSPQSQMSSSPSTTAFVTPASSLSGRGGEASQHPSTPPSPNPLSSQSTLAAVLAALHNKSPSPNPISSVRPISTRPAPPSPIAISRRQSTRSTISTISTRSGSGNLSVSKPVSRPVSGLVLFPDVKAEEPDPVAADVLSSTTEKPHPSPFFVPSSSSPVSTSPIKPQPPTRPAIIVRDYAFDATDDRYNGIGPFVPKWNKVERLIRVLVDAARDDEEAREKRRRKKERKEKKKSEKAKRKKKKVGNGWSGSESEDADASDNDNGWISSDSGSRMSSDDSSDSSDESSCELYDEHDDGFNQEEGYHPETEENYPEDYAEDIPSGPLLPGLYRALYAFEPEGEAEMGLDEGQVVRVVGRGGGEGWAVVVDEREGRESLGLGGHALVPESYLEVVSLDVEEDVEE